MTAVEIAVVFLFGAYGIEVLVSSVREFRKQGPRSQLLDQLRKEPITSEKFAALNTERDAILWERTKNRILTAVFGVSLLIVLATVEFDRPNGQQSRGLTGRQLVAAGALCVLYSVAVRLTEYRPGQNRLRLQPVVPYGGISIEKLDRLEEIDAQIAAFNSRTQNGND